MSSLPGLSFILTQTESMFSKMREIRSASDFGMCFQIFEDNIYTHIYIHTPLSVCVYIHFIYNLYIYRFALYINILEMRPKSKD